MAAAKDIRRTATGPVGMLTSGTTSGQRTTSVFSSNYAAVQQAAQQMQSHRRGEAACRTTSTTKWSREPYARASVANIGPRQLKHWKDRATRSPQSALCRVGLASTHSGFNTRGILAGGSTWRMLCCHRHWLALKCRRTSPRFI